MRQNKYPKVLVVSINQFSTTESNGKVMAQLFKNWDKDCLAQFYVYNEKPDSDVCNNYYRITDTEALKAVFTLKKRGGTVEYKKIGAEAVGNQDVVTRPVRRNSFTCLMRDAVWNSGMWKSKNFYNWVEDFSPELIFVMAGGSSFLHNISMSLSEKYGIPLVVFNTEKYYFIKHNYMKGKGGDMFFPAYHAECRSAFRRLMKKSSLEIYGNDVLKEIYDDEFKKNGTVIYQPTSVTPFPASDNPSPKVFSYIGTLGYGRPLCLMEIGKTLQKISNDLFVDIYGKSPDERTREMLLNAPGVRYHGFISSDEVIKKIKESDILLHAETFNPEILPILQTGFSTKISDCLASGRCFVLYADESIACAKYLIKNDCAMVITSPSKLEEMLRIIISDKKLRDYYIENAARIAQKNHNADKNCEILRNYLEMVVKKTQ